MIKAAVSTVPESGPLSTSTALLQMVLAVEADRRKTKERVVIRITRAAGMYRHMVGFFIKSL